MTPWHILHTYSHPDWLTQSLSFSLTSSLNRWAIMGASSATCTVAIGNFPLVRAHQSVCTRLSSAVEFKGTHRCSVIIIGLIVCVCTCNCPVYITGITVHWRAFTKTEREHPLAVLFTQWRPKGARQQKQRQRDRHKSVQRGKCQ